MNIIKAVPTNIITGALGAGKTTLIQQLLKSKPANERWAVLVNEFGEIGIDGAMLAQASLGQKDNESHQNVYIKEVPGGCMCCVSGLPMNIALNQLLSHAKPHRLLIEPTGLGHPNEVIETLNNENYQKVINLQSTLCLVDARKMNNQQWREHQTFKEQFEVADHIIMTKSDLYNCNEKKLLENYLTDIGCNKTPVSQTNRGVIAYSLLTENSKFNTTSPLNEQRLFGAKQQKSLLNNLSSIPSLSPEKNKVIRKKHERDGFYAHGWVWPSKYSFNYDEVSRLFNDIDTIRLKALLITNCGIYSFNGQDNHLTVNEYDEAQDSRLEIITDTFEKYQQTIDKIECLFSA